MLALKLDTFEKQFSVNPFNFIQDMSNYSTVELMLAYANSRRSKSVAYGVASQLKEIESRYGKFLPIYIDSNFHSLFANFLSDRGLKKSTILSYQQSLVAAITWGIPYNVKAHPTYKDYRTKTFKPDRYAFSADDLSLIAHFDVTTIKDKRVWKKMRQIQDSIIIQCNLGQRHSDMKNLVPSLFTDGELHIFQQKTKKMAVVDLKKFAFDYTTLREVLERNNYQFPYHGDNGNYNEGIKRLLRYIGKNFDKTITIQQDINGVVENTEAKVWQICGSHTCRRSFVTHNFKKGIPANEIMRATGHASMDMVARYNCN